MAAQIRIWSVMSKASVTMSPSWARRSTWRSQVPLRSAQVDRLNGITVPAAQHERDPAVHRLGADIHDPAFGRGAQDRLIADAGCDGLALEGRQIGAVGRDKLLILVEHRETVADGIDRIPQPPLGHDGRGMGVLQVGQETAVLPLQRLGLGQRAAHDLPLFDDLLGERARMQRELLVRREKLALLLLQQPFRRQTPAPLFRQTFPDIHARPRRGRLLTARGRKVRAVS